MKILIIADNIGRTAPGIVFERLVQGLSKKNELDLLVTSFEPSLDLSLVKNIYLEKNIELHPRISKFLIGLFAINPFDYFWSKRNSKKVLNNDYDLILCFVSFHHYLPLVASVILKKQMGIKAAVYSVDAIPAPKGWPDNEFYRAGVYRMMKKYLPKFDGLFSSNQKMLDYQLSTFDRENKVLADVVFNPGISAQHNYVLQENEFNNFVYTGGIYGVRKVDYVFKAFEKLLLTYPKSRLIFVGSVIEPGKLDNIKPEAREKILVEPFAKDLSAYYKSATALIDIDADIENDVFLSSKITNYIMCNRIIISETGKNSPSRDLFKGIRSIVQCNHDSEELLNAMVFAIENYKIMTYEDRKEVIDSFSLESVVDSFNKNLNSL
ncbi:hypothetical protein ACP6L2_12300 [Sphingobacterium lactis]|uniref:hypothetical protein n=1 Tax=Sphingobacterium lactis TaxID=797291 RepID=UPI003F7D2DB9